MTARWSLCVIPLLVASSAWADSVNLFLKVSGNDVLGEPEITSLGRAGSIQCVAFDLGSRVAINSATGAAAGRRTYAPVKFVKAIDRSSVALWKALVQNENVEATFKFFRTNPVGGNDQHYFTVKLTKARISAFRQFTPQANDPQSQLFPVWEEVEVSFSDIECTYEIGGISHRDVIRVVPPTAGGRVPPPQAGTVGAGRRVADVPRRVPGRF